MRIYKLTLWSEIESSEGYKYYTTRKDAEVAKRDYDDAETLRSAKIEVLNIEPTKAGILHALRVHASHADNG